MFDVNATVAKLHTSGYVHIRCACPRCIESKDAYPPVIIAIAVLEFPVVKVFLVENSGYLSILYAPAV